MYNNLYKSRNKAFDYKRYTYVWIAYGFYLSITELIHIYHIILTLFFICETIFPMQLKQQMRASGVVHYKFQTCNQYTFKHKSRVDGTIKCFLYRFQLPSRHV